MFHAFQSPDKSSKKNDSSSSKKKTSNIDYLEMMRARTLFFGEINAPAAQMMVDEKEDKLAQKKTIQKSASEEKELMQGKLVQKSAPEEEELMQGKMVQHQKEDELQMKSESCGTKDSVQSSGTTTQMPEGVQSKMENSFGTSFGGVNIHQNDNSATQMGALAYTQGNNVHFAPGQYNPESSKGQELLGHELTHVVQQRQGRVQPTKQGKSVEVAGNGSGFQKKEGKDAANGGGTITPGSDMDGYGNSPPTGSDPNNPYSTEPNKSKTVYDPNAASEFWKNKGVHGNTPAKQQSRRDYVTRNIQIAESWHKPNDADIRNGVVAGAGVPLGIIYFTLDRLLPAVIFTPGYYYDTDSDLSYPRPPLIM